MFCGLNLENFSPSLFVRNYFEVLKILLWRLRGYLGEIESDCQAVWTCIRTTIQEIIFIVILCHDRCVEFSTPICNGCRDSTASTFIRFMTGPAPIMITKNVSHRVANIILRSNKYSG